MTRFRLSLDPLMLAAIFAAVAGAFLSWVVHAPWSLPNVYSDILAFWSRGWLANGQIPYLDAFFEYPPLAAGIVYFARIIGQNPIWYYNIIGALSAIAAAVLGYSCYRVAKLGGGKVNSALILMPSMVFYGVYNFDLFQVTFIMLSLLFLLEDRDTLSGAATALGILTKLVNILLIPVFLMQISGWRRRLKYLAVVLIVLAVVHLPLAYLNFNNWFQVFVSERNGGLEDAWYIWIFQNQSTWDAAKLFGIGIGGLVLLRVYTMRIPTVQKSFLTLVAFLLSTHVYTPQFNVMLIPFVAVMAIEHPSYYLWDVFNVGIILTWFTTPGGYPTAPYSWPQTLTLLRDAALAWLALQVAFPGRGLRILNPYPLLRRIIR